MIIRFGFVAMSLVLADSSPSKTVTATNLAKIPEQDAQHSRLLRLARENLVNSLRILRHAHAHDIQVYRFTSKLIPLATHPITSEWKWPEELQDEFTDLGNFIKEHNIRVSAHPDHFTLLNSPREEVLTAAINDLIYHHQLFQSMGLGPEAKLVLHVGGKYGDKETSIDRFLTNFYKVPQEIRQRIILENDDKCFDSDQVLNICENLSIPMVLDLHHHYCLPSSQDLDILLPRIFATWENTGLVPKIHLSSPKSPKNFRSHADNVDPQHFLNFLLLAKKLDQNFDVMIEAKNKDLALFNFMDQMKKISNIKVESEAIISY